MNSGIKYNKSYLKWAGSKLRVLGDVLEAIGDCKNKIYIEPFVGSCNVALNIDALGYKLSDTNERLISTHKMVSSKPEDVKSSCEIYFDLGTDVYYHVRDNYNSGKNKETIMGAAEFIYLNKHCFNGQYRENKKGGFNVPVNKDAKPNVPYKLMKDFCLESSYFECCDYKESMIGAGKDNVIYIDPPYPHDSISDSEIRYTKDGFSKQDHLDLKVECKKASENGARVIVSYCDIPFIRELYSDADEIIEINASRSISSKSSTRGKAKELIIIYRGNDG